MLLFDLLPEFRREIDADRGGRADDTADGCLYDDEGHAFVLAVLAQEGASNLAGIRFPGLLLDHVVDRGSHEDQGLIGGDGAVSDDGSELAIGERKLELYGFARLSYDH